MTKGANHSKLVQRNIRSVKNTDREFSRVTSGNEIPIVLVPKAPRLYQFGVAVPSGPYVLYQRWHKDMGKLDPGVVWVLPFWKRISHIVSSATITYNAPAQDCPTADNGRSCSMSLFTSFTSPDLSHTYSDGQCGSIPYI